MFQSPSNRVKCSDFSIVGPVVVSAVSFNLDPITRGLKHARELITEFKSMNQNT